ncbi:hypothetical protein CFN78_05860 [Amycolatopsis antarctica]|uniref:ATP synthase protein I n=2 Tax=Amycolatopsis antarctica TaxID=1854586 RepID=A0A263D9E7_9PSEU|nr:hypothetical protein CFN78_05860 [Amycolatopsis antarctica]
MLDLANSMLRTALLPSAATVAAGVLVSTLWVGLPGLFGALVGGGLAVASCLLTILMMRKSAALMPALVMAVALGGYVFKLMVLMIVMTLLRGVEVLHPYALSLTLLAVILVWAGAEVVAYRKAKIPAIIPSGR